MKRPMKMSPILGLMGILLAALTAEFNDGVTSTSIADVQGGLGISHDQGTWLISLYATAQTIGMTQATFWALTFSIRRWVLFAIGLCFVTTVSIPLTSNLTVLYALRILEGLSAGFTIPLLLAVALQALPPPTRLYGLSAYALTATFGPNVAAALAGLWTSQVSWQFIFLEDVPLCALSSVLVWYGVPQQPANYKRIASYDWTGSLLIVTMLGAFTTMLEQGDRFDWFNSVIICVLALVSAVTLPLFLANEMLVEMPLFRFTLLRRRNVAYAVTALFVFLLLNLSASTIPISYLTQVVGYRPEQAAIVTAAIAVPQLIMLPLTAWLLDFKVVDARVVSIIGVGCVIGACVGDSFLTSVWQSGEFLLWQSLQAIGGPLIVLPLLMMATNSILRPEEGPFGSTLVNTSRGLAEPVGVWLVQLMVRWRGALHRNRIVDQSGQGSFDVLNHHNTASFGRDVEAQTTVLTLSDAFLVIGVLAVGLLVLLLALPERTYPPRVVFAKD